MQFWFLMIMIMTSGWGLQQRPTSPITKNTVHKKIKIDNEHELSQAGTWSDAVICGFYKD